MTREELMREWDEATARLKDADALRHLKKLLEYCDRRTSCEGCILRAYCQKGGGK